MIKQSESGLTTDEYNMLASGKDADGNLLTHAFEVVAHRYNPIYTDYGGSGAAASNETAEFGVCAAGVYLFRGTSGGVIERLDTTSVTPAWSTVRSVPPPDERATPLALAFNSDAGRLFVYACTNTGIKSIYSNDYGTTWTNWFDEYVTPIIPVSPAKYGDSLTTTPANGSASSVLNGDTAVYGPGRAFGNGLTLPAGTEIWASGAPPTLAAPQWLQYDFGTARSITKYTILGRSSDFFGQNPRDWTIESSPDASVWTVIDTRVNVTNWSSNELKTFIISPLTTVEASLPTARRYWRIKMTRHNGDVLCVALREFDMFTTEFGNSDPGYISAITAPRWNRIHMTTRPYPDLALFRFETLERDAFDVWTGYVSEIYWTFPVRSLHSAQSSTERDTIVIASDIPGTLTVKSENNSAQKYIFTAGGVFAFTYQYQTWSDHIDVETVSDVRAWRYRDDARIANIRGRLYVTAYSSDATEEYPITGHRMYTSSPESRYWSNGSLVPLPAGAGAHGVAYVAVGNYVYAIQAKKMYRTDSTLYFGYSPSSVQLDLTHSLTGYEFSQESIFQSGFMLANPDNVLWNHAVLNKNNTVLLTHKSGYWTPAGGGLYEKTMVLIAITQVESLEYTYENPVMKIRVTARDTMGRMTDYVQSEQAVNWKSQAIGGDNYADKTNSNYGGLGHTAAETGAFQTRNNALEINSTQESIAFSTLTSNQWNGSQQVGFLLNPGGSVGQLMGVVFRAIDSFNLWSVDYSAALDKLSLSRRINGVQTIFWNSATLGWTANTAIMRYIRVEFYYGRLVIYTSTDSAVAAFDGGKQWTYRSTHYVDCRTKVYGEPYLQRLENCIPELGYVGVLGYGGVTI